MLFNSYIFIFIFFPLCISGFYALSRLKNDVYAKLWLIGLSLWFYGYFNTYYLLIMVLSIVLNYVLTIFLMGKNGGIRRVSRKLILIIGIVLNLGVLFYFKYFDFFLTAVNDVFKLSLPLKQILLPLGISFFTFQQIGYLVDVYRNEVTEVDFVNYALFVSFFPQLIAGPIVSQADMMPQFKTIKDRKIDSEQISRGLVLFILGLSKKVLVADTFGKAVDAGYASMANMGGLDCFLIMIWYTLQLYFDFSGYCDMARGLARMLGFDIAINFDSPYKSTNIIEFWKKWHITLTRFFTKYVYIPLGGNRKGNARMLLNILIIYFLSGLWHGAGYNYILWGMIHGVAYVICRALQLAKKENTEKSKALNPIFASAIKVIKTFVTFIYVSIAWVYFRAPSISEGTALLKQIFVGSWTKVDIALSNVFKVSELWYVVKLLHIDRNYLLSQNLLMVVITLAALVVIFIAPNAGEVAKKIKPKLGYALLFAVLGIWCVVSLSEVSTFLYFNF